MKWTRGSGKAPRLNEQTARSRAGFRGPVLFLIYSWLFWFGFALMESDSSIFFAPGGGVKVNTSGETGSFTVKVSTLPVRFTFVRVFVLGLVIFIVESLGCQAMLASSALRSGGSRRELASRINEPASRDATIPAGGCTLVVEGWEGSLA